MTLMQRKLLTWYAAQGRAWLPWRASRQPYEILVAEFMLQQTQAERVVSKYHAFLARFRDPPSLAEASVADVLRAWQGLGYNMRALRLKRIARALLERHGGTVPHDEAALRALPGVGPYTAAAVRAFAFECDDAAVDTNVARVTHRIKYGLEHPPVASIAQLRRDALSFVPPGQAHQWNSAMMDLGALICTARTPRCGICPARRHCAAAPIDVSRLKTLRTRGRSVKPERFERTTRYARGRIIEHLRSLQPHERISLFELHGTLQPHVAASCCELRSLVDALAREGLVESVEGKLALSSER